MWSKAEDEKIDAIGVLCLDEQGHVKDHKLVKATVGKEAGIGLARDADSGRPRGGHRRRRRPWCVAKKGLGLTDDNRDQLAASLKDGKAAVGVLVEPHDADVIYKQLTELGGTVQLLEVSERLDECSELLPLHRGDTIRPPPRRAAADHHHPPSGAPERNHHWRRPDDQASSRVSSTSMFATPSGLGAIRAAQGTRRCTERDLHRLGRHRVLGDGALRRSHRDAQHEEARRQRPDLHEVAHHGDLFADPRAAS